MLQLNTAKPDDIFADYCIFNQISVKSAATLDSWSLIKRKLLRHSVVKFLGGGDLNERQNNGVQATEGNKPPSGKINRQIKQIAF